MARLSDILQSFQENARRYSALEQLFSKSNLNLQQPTKTVLSAAVRMFAAVILVPIPALMIAFSVSSHTAFDVLLVFLIAHVVEGYVLGPIVQHRWVYLPPALILANQFFMVVVAGSVGIALATPLLVIEMVLVERLYFHEAWDNKEVAA
jgi:predicted PurR-regulated permease PerM